jgi:predicted transcriptional regulator
MTQPAPVADHDETERQAVLVREAAGVAKALASAAAGRVVDEAEVNAWIDSIGTDHELPVPYSGR